MTREEAYRLAMRACEETWNKKTCKQILEALKPEPCDDCISRQAVLEIQVKYAEHIGATKYWQMRDDIRALPSVTPQYTEAEIQKMQELEQAEIQKAYELGKAEQQKTGRWIKHDTGHSIYYDCSLCGCVAPCTETADKILWKMANYCYDCGAKMENDGERWR